MELSPPSFRTFVVGTAYQLGNLVSSASSTIEAIIGEKFPLEPKMTKNGPIKRYQYGKVICILMGCVCAYCIIMIFLGLEYLGRDFDVKHDEDLQAAAREHATAAMVFENPSSDETRAGERRLVEDDEAV